MRCHFQTQGSPRFFCGELASWMRAGSLSFSPGYFCNAHHSIDDVAIPAEKMFRRVSMTVEILFASVSLVPAEAHAEVLARLELAVEQAGGVLNLHTVTSAIGRSSQPAAPERARGGRARVG